MDKGDSSRTGHSTTAVFWAVDDCPIPKDDNLRSVLCKIRTYLEDFRGYVFDHEPVEFFAFGEKEIASRDEIVKARLFYISEADKDIRANLTIIHILNCSWFEPMNLMVISKDFSDNTEFVRVLRCLQSRGHNVLLVQPHDEATSQELFRTPASISACTSLMDQGGISQAYLINNVSVDYKDFSKTIRRRRRGRPVTGVFWDVDDSPFPDDLDPPSIHEKLVSALKAKKYVNDVTIWAYTEKITFSDDLLDKYRKCNIYFLAGGDKNARVNRMIHDMHLWAMDTPRVFAGPSNAIVISNNIQTDGITTYYLIPRVIDFIFTLICFSSKGYNSFLAEPKDQLVPEKSICPDWPGCLLDTGNVIGSFKLAPSLAKRWRKKTKPAKKKTKPAQDEDQSCSLEKELKQRGKERGLSFQVKTDKTTL